MISVIYMPLLADLRGLLRRYRADIITVMIFTKEILETFTQDTTETLILAMFLIADKYMAPGCFPRGNLDFVKEAFGAIL